jgi:hypothetical protein
LLESGAALFVELVPLAAGAFCPLLAAELLGVGVALELLLLPRPVWY